MDADYADDPPIAADKACERGIVEVLRCHAQPANTLLRHFVGGYRRVIGGIGVPALDGGYRRVIGGIGVPALDGGYRRVIGGIGVPALDGRIIGGIGVPALEIRKPQPEKT